jgi:hypothetical protein
VDGKNRKNIIMDLVVIICHYKENLDWINGLKHKYIVYNKNENDIKKYDFDLPEGMITNQFNNLWNDVEEQLKQNKRRPHTNNIIQTNIGRDRILYGKLG